jgi:hypothetical protein
MRLTPRQRHQQPEKAPRVWISQAEITADLLYPAAASRPAPNRVAGRGRRR